ncbi:MAG: OadG family protein [Lachnospiraceae bacterium]|nr:OadG family protein [Lachnospiraceae bacterium]
MKKFLLTLALTACVFGMTACGNQNADNAVSLTQQDAVDMATKVSTGLDQLAKVDDLSQDVKALNAEADGAGDVMEDSAALWVSALEEIGTYEGVVEESVVIEGTADEFTISYEIRGSLRNADVELYYTDEYLDLMVLPPTMMISPQYTLGEKMTKAGLNTLLGMGTVFMVLILIMAIIYAFGLIPKIEKALADKKAKKQSKTEVAVDNTIAQIIEKEELSDDTELVAVIAAAIAAYEGAASTDGFVVRSIKRANTNKWQRA